MTGYRPAATTEGWWQLAARASAAQAGPPAPAAVPGGAHPAPWQQRWFWLIAVLVALAALVVGGSAQHAVDQRRAARAFYGTQVLSAASRLLDEENRQIALPVARRSAAAFGSLGDSIGNDLGINGENTLGVTLGTGSTAPLTQIAFEVTVSSPYASTTFVLWTVRGPGPQGNAEQNVGSCLMSSTLLGPGRATTGLNFDESGLQPCTPDLWRPSPRSAVKPDLALAGIRTTVG
jgi:hypothetical protein